MDSIQTFRYADIFSAMYFNDARMCTHRNHEHVLVYMYSGELEINERGKITRLHRGDCAFVRRDNQVQLTKQSRKGEQFKAIFLMFTHNFLREFYMTLDKSQLPAKSKRNKISLCKLPVRPDITSLFESMTPYFDSSIQPTDELLKLKITEGVYALLNTDKSFYSSLFDFTEPWKIDILGFLNENYMYELSLEEIARYTGRSLATFKRDFSKISDLSPQKWLIRKRLEVSYNKLQEENKKVSDVYTEVGFKNLTHFYSAYKKQYGYSPAKK
jgi:AraC-like DNA-binding protein